MERIPEISVGDRMFAGLQYLLPKHLLSRVIYSVMRSESPALKRLLIGNFLRGYQVNMAEAVQSDPYAYRSFNDFFTRALRPGARTLAPGEDVVVSPVDGTVSQAGSIHDRAIIQAKGLDYSLDDLLAQDAKAVAAYRNGSFACIYLAPYNYHRVHMPFGGRLINTVYVPGDLFSVNAATARAVPRVFARNERVICEFETTLGRMAVILVGALFVGSMETVYAGEINPPPRPATPALLRSRHSGSRPSKLKAIPIPKGIGQTFAKGAELGRFNMGSTVVLLFEPNRVRWEDFVQPQATVQMGSAIAAGRP